MSKRRIAVLTQATSVTTTVNAKRHYEGIIETFLPTTAADASFVFQVDNSVVQSVTQISLATEYPTSTTNSSRTATLTGTSGTANIIVGGVNYLATFTTNLTTSATNFVTSHAAALLALGITVTSSGAVLTFVAATATFPTITDANVSGDLDSTIAAVAVIATTGLPIATIDSYAKDYFKVRITNKGASSLNFPVKVHYQIVHD